ncbi:MAG TPA: bifunctional hydroxymethylpyrimidine kinase/phosphomethylpyrimidine kinase [Dokdonella sp.]|uniref:bifunctional hydroxymethylpyrimidine kinase/phosphomethylpyrimidine kinase n=1 Tax=Dokdonella sp. TaxID=2291710 RepID=UPI002CDA0282|nr:bifunctional hydroxymethylpyrimidine kinase/phosphomethylpyrimidine kinase [Dokdonella sp.]HUD43095.1 bifunctional hydroxymethylpyrimidine kinase/phosphomethylpyrimidine kinase [Dokdonella sp.]
MTISASRRRRAPPAVLTIAGSDSGGGAGIQADLKTFAAFGTHGLCAITAVTAQNTRTVAAIEQISAGLLRGQIGAVFDDFAVAAVKIGMLGSATAVRTVAEALEERPGVPLVLDPVMVATSGAALAGRTMTAALQRHLLARADLLTPNLPEAERLLGAPIVDRRGMREAARALRALGCRAVLLKGGHLPGRRIGDLLLDERGESWFEHARLVGEGHGTGCTLAAAVAAGLAWKRPLGEAVGAAIDYVHRAFAAGYRPGRGTLVVLDHGVQVPPAD